jgi:hypothetical protein
VLNRLRGCFIRNLFGGYFVDKLDYFLEGIEEDMDGVKKEAVVSPELRKKYVEPQQKAARSGEKKAPKGKHTDSPLDKARTRAIETAGSGKKFKVYSVDQLRRDTDTDNSEDLRKGTEADYITPDHLFAGGGGFSRKNPAIVFIWYHKDGKLFWSGKGEGILDEYDGESVRTHEDLQAEVSNQIDRKYSWDIGEVHLSVVMGRYWNGVVSFWNGLDEKSAEFIVNRLKKECPHVDQVKEIWVADKEEYERP